jgi:hypothetical protein
MKSLHRDRIASGILLSTGLAMMHQTQALAHADHYKEKEAEPKPEHADMSDASDMSDISDMSEQIENHDPGNMEQAEQEAIDSSPIDAATEAAETESLEQSPPDNQADRNQIPIEAAIPISSEPTQANALPSLGLGESLFLLIASAPILLFAIKRKMRG